MTFPSRFSTVLAALAILAGAFIAIQAGINSQLGVVLKNPVFATLVAFCVSAALTLLGTLFLSRQYPTVELIRSVPLHLWFGGILSAIGVALFYILIPKMGVGTMMSLALTGQLITAVVAAHYGWFGHPPSLLTPTKVLGILAMILGMTLINR